MKPNAIALTDDLARRRIPHFFKIDREYKIPCVRIDPQNDIIVDGVCKKVNWITSKRQKTRVCSIKRNATRIGKTQTRNGAVRNDCYVISLCISIVRYARKLDCICDKSSGERIISKCSIKDAIYTRRKRINVLLLISARFIDPSCTGDNN